MSKQVFGKPKEQKPVKKRKKDNYDFNLENQIIDVINKRYVSMRKKYLVMNKSGEYTQVNYEKNNIKLNDNELRQHLRGNKTIGIFAGSHLTKCLIFDLDIEDKNIIKWAAYKIRNCLVEFGFPQDRIYISFSGNKGYHISIYFDELVQYETIEKLYITTLTECDLSHLKEKIELRPQPGLGVKLPIGRNFKNTDKDNNICYFCDFDNGLKIIKDKSYILNLQPITKEEYENIIERLKDDDYIYNESKLINENDIRNTKTELNQTYREPKSFRENIDENETIDSIQNILINGLSMPGTRNNSVLKIAKLFNYYGLSLDECISNLKEWMEWQNKQYYKTPMDKCILEIERISKYVYENNITLTIPVKDINVYKSEIIEIMKLDKNTHKLILYALIIHSKRYANKDGIFYATYNQLEKSTGITQKTIVKIIRLLEENNFIEVISRNRKIEGTYKKLPNKYRIKFELVSDENNTYEDFNIIEGNNNDQESNFLGTVCNLFSDDELKNICSRRQYEHFKRYRVSTAV